MIKRTLYFGNPAYLSLRLQQLVVKPTEGEDSTAQPPPRTIPIEDIGIVVLDHPRITVTSAVLDCLLDNNCAVITCNASHMPAGLLLPLAGHTLQSKRFRSQIEASLPLRKQLWQQTVRSKIANQAAVLCEVTGRQHPNMASWSNSVKSGDPENLEARAAAYYWKSLFPDDEPFVRGRYGESPNNLLNYGYAVLRAVVARALVSSGLLPTFGIHHHNRYNAYCLADDIMEPYRPFVDRLVFNIWKENLYTPDLALDKPIKTQLLSIPTLDVTIDRRESPLMVAVARTAATLAKCFAGEMRKIAYPEFA